MVVLCHVMRWSCCAGCCVWHGTAYCEILMEDLGVVLGNNLPSVLKPFRNHVLDPVYHSGEWWAS